MGKAWGSGFVCGHGKSKAAAAVDIAVGQEAENGGNWGLG